MNLKNFQDNIDNGKLKVYLKVENKSSIYWGFGEMTGDIWNAAQLTIRQISHFKEFSFVFEGKIK